MSIGFQLLCEPVQLGTDRSAASQPQDVRRLSLCQAAVVAEHPRSHGSSRRVPPSAKQSRPLDGESRAYRPKNPVDRQSRAGPSKRDVFGPAATLAPGLTNYVEKLKNMPIYYMYRYVSVFNGLLTMISGKRFGV